MLNISLKLFTLIILIQKIEISFYYYCFYLLNRKNYHFYSYSILFLIFIHLFFLKFSLSLSKDPIIYDLFYAFLIFMGLRANFLVMIYLSTYGCSLYLVALS